MTVLSLIVLAVAVTMDIPCGAVVALLSVP